MIDGAGKKIWKWWLGRGEILACAALVAGGYWLVLTGPNLMLLEICISHSRVGVEVVNKDREAEADSIFQGCRWIQGNDQQLRGKKIGNRLFSVNSEANSAWKKNIAHSDLAHKKIDCWITTKIFEQKRGQQYTWAHLVIANAVGSFPQHPKTHAIRISWLLPSQKKSARVTSASRSTSCCRRLRISASYGRH